MEGLGCGGFRFEALGSEPTAYCFLCFKMWVWGLVITGLRLRLKVKMQTGSRVVNKEVRMSGSGFVKRK